MKNNLNERRSNAIIVIAAVCALVFAVIGLIAGLIAGIDRKRRENAEQPKISRYLLIDAADGLRHSSSALRLCNEDETASETARLALVYAVRAETALECDQEFWCDCRAGEGFLNDAAALLSSGDAKNAVKFADELYDLSRKFYAHVTDGAPFDYDGELEMRSDKSDDRSDGGSAIAEGADDRAMALVNEVLGDTELKQIGAYENAVEFASDGCYATVRDGKLAEFAFSSGGADIRDDDAESAAEKIAERCGYAGLSVYSVSRNDGIAVVKLCDRQGGAYCRDECATVVIADGKVRAFSSGHCGNKHDVPKAKVDEQTARRSAPERFSSSLSGEGRPVTTFDGSRDRICYEYRYVLDDGEHFVYVCAESGKQMQVR